MRETYAPLEEPQPQQGRQPCLRTKLGAALLILGIAVVVGGGSSVGTYLFLSSQDSPVPPVSPTPSASTSASSSPSPAPASPSPSTSQVSKSPSSTSTHTASPSPVPPSASPTPSAPNPRWYDLCETPPFEFWNGMKPGNAWYDFLDVNNDSSFESTAELATGERTVYDVHVDWADHHAVQLFANPDFLQLYDDRIRDWNPLSSTYSGTIDSCGWPGEEGDPGSSKQFPRKTDCFYEDFRYGWNSSRVKIALTKTCCSAHGYTFPNATSYPSDRNSPKYSANVGLEEDDVEYPPNSGNVQRKNVLRLTAVNSDNLDPSFCGGCVPGFPETCTSSCHKQVDTAGLVQTADLFSSGRYEVIAKVPAVSGLVWAMWTYHQEVHLAYDCQKYGCYIDGYRGVDPDFPPQRHWKDCCGPDCCSYLPNSYYDNLGRNYSHPACCDNLAVTGQCPGIDRTLCDDSWGDQERKCVEKHPEPDPQFTNNATMNSWKIIVNHEIDIEIPANCLGTSVCGQACQKSDNYTQREHTGCIGRFNTVNLNNYIFTTSGGTGPAYSNMCVSVKEKETGKPFQLIGDGHYHKYTIDWHSGGVKCEDGKISNGRVDFYVDDLYLGSNNVFVPTRAGRLFVGLWAPDNTNWANWPDYWGGGYPGDGEYYLTHAYISEIRIQPHNEPRDIIYPDPFDQPDGCDMFYLSNNSCHKFWENLPAATPVVANPSPGVLETHTCNVTSP